MVVKKIKFMCDMGVSAIYYCKTCGTPHLSRLDAETCEKSHIELAPFTELEIRVAPHTSH